MRMPCAANVSRRAMLRIPEARCNSTCRTYLAGHSQRLQHLRQQQQWCRESKCTRVPIKLHLGGQHNIQKATRKGVTQHQEQSTRDVEAEVDAERAALAAFEKELETALDKAEVSRRRSMRMANHAAQMLQRAKSLVASNGSEEDIRQALQDKASAIKAMEHFNERAAINLALAFRLEEATGEKQRNLLSLLSDLPNGFHAPRGNETVFMGDLEHVEILDKLNQLGKEAADTGNINTKAQLPLNPANLRMRESSWEDLISVPINGYSDDDKEDLASKRA